MTTRQHAVKSRTPAGDVFSVVVIQVLRLHGLLTAIGDALAEPAGQTSARWQVLAAIEEEPRPVAEIARLLGFARQSVQRLADVLEAEGHAAYEDNPHHQRAKLLRLTPSGKRALGMIKAAQAEWANRLGAALGRTQLQRTADELQRMLEALQNDPR